MMKILFVLTTLFVLSNKSLAFGEDIRDIRPPISLPPNFLFLLVMLTILISIIVFLVILFILKKLKKESIPKEIIRPPHEVAYERLEELRRQDLPSQDLIKEFFIRLSDIVRRYIEDRFQIRAPEMTTDEFLSYLRNSDKLMANHKDLLKDFLNCCDMVKFAKYGPPAQEIENSFASARRLVDETKPVVEVQGA